MDSRIRFCPAVLHRRIVEPSNVFYQAILNERQLQCRKGNKVKKFSIQQVMLDRKKNEAHHALRSYFLHEVATV
jgi:hypothetical protein